MNITTIVFKGSSEKIKGYVFQTYAEQGKKGQFITTMAELQVYVAENFKDDAEHFKCMFRDLKHPGIPKPQKDHVPSDKVYKKLVPQTGSDGTTIDVEITVDDRDDDEKDIDKMIFNEQVKQWIKDCSRLEATERSLFEIIRGQCSRLLQTSIKAEDEYETVDQNGNVAGLLRVVPRISSQIQSDLHVYDAYLEAKQNFENYYQGENVDISTYLKNFKHFADCADQVSEGMFEPSGLVAYEKSADADSGMFGVTDAEYKARVREKILAVSFVMNANMKVYRGLIDDLRDQYLFKNDIYPETLQVAYTLLKNHSSAKRAPKPSHLPHQSNDDTGVIRGVQHAQQGAVAGTDDKTWPSTKCHACFQQGHLARNCSNPRNSKEPSVTGTQ